MSLIQRLLATCALVGCNEAASRVDDGTSPGPERPSSADSEPTTTTDTGSASTGGGGGGGDGPSQLYDPAAYASVIWVSLDGVSEYRNDDDPQAPGGHFYATPVLPATPGACAESTRVQVSSISYGPAEGYTVFDVTFEGTDFTVPAALPTAPFEHGVGSLDLHDWEGMSLAVTSGGTATYTQPQPDLHRFDLDGVALCDGTYIAPAEMDPAVHCVLVTEGVIELTGVLGADVPRYGIPGWTGPSGRPICVLP